MKFVELYKIEPVESQSVVVICRLLHDTVVCEGDKIIIEKLTNEGLLNDGKRIFPKDGMTFLKCLRFSFKSGYLCASDIMDSDISSVT